jgi:hypothetical protein
MRRRCRSSSRLASLGFVVAAYALPACVSAGEDDAAPTRSPLVGGKTSDPCAWQSVGWLPGLCTATLVHPRVIVFAGHCGADITTFELAGPTRRSVPVDSCMVHPDGGPGNGLDVAFCVLAEAVDDVPIIPVLAGCEQTVLAVGRSVTLVGFGSAGDSASIGAKRELETSIAAVGTELVVGGDGKSICDGDSGGPAFVRLSPDVDARWEGSWRLAGVASSTDSAVCDGERPARIGAITKSIAWIESASGFDITPCFDSDGAWQPTSSCRGFPVASSGEQHDATCLPGADTGWSASCGVPFDPSSSDAGSGCSVSPPSRGVWVVMMALLAYLVVTPGARRRPRRR